MKSNLYLTVLRIFGIIILLTGFLQNGYGQCNKISYNIDAITIVDDSGCPGGNATITITIDGAISGGNPSFCVGYVPTGGTTSNFVNVTCFDVVDVPVTNHSVTITVPCNAESFGLSGWTNPAGGGSQCRNPAPIVWANSLLPIQLVSFEGNQMSNESFELKWTTGSEINNEYFSIERSIDGTNFISIGKEQGSNFSTKLNHYSFIDKNPLKGLNYYRLKQYDFDGNSQASDIIVMNNLSDLETKVMAFDNKLKVFTKGSVQSLEIYSFDGRLVKTYSNLNQKEFNTSMIENGNYAVKMTLEDRVMTQKLYIH